MFLLLHLFYLLSILLNKFVILFLFFVVFLFIGNIQFLFCLKNYRGIYYIIMVFLIAKRQTAKAKKDEDKARSVFETKR